MKIKYPYSKIKNSFHQQEPWLNVIFLRYITLPLVFLITNFTKITPNFISIFSLIFGVSSAYFYTQNEVYYGAVLYFISYIFDAIDGKVARIAGTGKIYGAWADILIDRINLTLITTAIAYNYHTINQDFKLLLLNCLFLGLVFIGWESRYNIDRYKLLNSKQFKDQEENNSKYQKWCKRNGLITMPISLVEVFLFYLILAPLLSIEYYSLVIVIFFLALRIITQQFFWFNVSKLQ